VAGQAIYASGKVISIIKSIGSHFLFGLGISAISFLESSEQ